MSVFHGLHNPERHESAGWIALTCVDCEVSCYESMPCRCCLAAEVERLTAALAERDRRIAHALARLQWAACTVRGCTNPGCAAVHEARAILRGES